MNAITKKITGFKVKTEGSLPTPVATMHEGLKRPEKLFGATYKIKTPQSEHALYVTINDMEVADIKVPFEIFVNSKNMENFQWITALTRTMSATFRKGGDITFLVDEMKSVFDPHGGYFKKGGRFMASVVAEIGCVIEEHLLSTGHIKREEMPEHVKLILAEKRSQFDGQATLCGRCGETTVVLMDGCKTCLSCSDSKCG